MGTIFRCISQFFHDYYYFLAIEKQANRQNFPLEMDDANEKKKSDKNLHCPTKYFLIKDTARKKLLVFILTLHTGPSLNFQVIKARFYKNNLKTAANPKICMIQP